MQFPSKQEILHLEDITLFVFIQYEFNKGIRTTTME